MKLTVIENIWGEKVEIGYRGGFFTKELIAMTLVAVILIVEIPIILLLLKKLAPSDFNFLLITLVFLALVIGILILLFFSVSPKLVRIKTSKSSEEIELEWRRNLLFKTQQTIAHHLVNKMLITLFRAKSKNRVKIEIEKFNGERTIATFPFEPTDYHENFDRVLLNLAKIVGFETYTAKRGVSVYEVLFDKSSRGKALIDESQRELKFEADDREESLRDIQIPNLTIKELSGLKISIYKKPNLYDLIRLFSIFVLFPALLVFVYFEAGSKTYAPIFVTLIVFILIAYQMRRLISPMETTIDRLRGVIKVRKLFFSHKFQLSELEKIELSDQVIRRVGNFVFHVDGRLKNGKVHQLFYTEFANEAEKIYEVYENLNFLLSYISKNLGITTIDKTKHLP